MATREHDSVMVCGDSSRLSVILTLFFKKQGDDVTIGSQPMIIRILMRISIELLMPEKNNQGIDRSAIHTVLAVSERFPELVPSITHLYNQFSSMRGKIPILFTAGLLIHHVSKIKEWADTQFRPVISHYCQEALTELNKIESPNIPVFLRWVHVPKPTTSESRPSEVIEITDSEAPQNTELSEVAGSSSSPEIAVSQPVEESEEVPRLSPPASESTASIPELSQYLNQISVKLPSTRMTEEQSHSINPNSSDERGDKRTLEDQGDNSTELVNKRQRIRNFQVSQEGKLEDLGLSCGTVVTILSRNYTGCTAVYVGPSKSRTHQRVIIMDEKLGPLQTHLYGDNRARVESTQIIHEVAIEENTREVTGTLANLTGNKFVYDRNIAIRIIQIGSPFKDKLASAFNSWSDNALIWIHGETAPRYIDNATKVVFYVPNRSESPTV